MNIEKWRLIDTIGLALSIILCFAGFWAMNSEYLIEHLARFPPSSRWYLGVGLFIFGLTSFIFLENGKKFKQGNKRFNTKIAFLIIVFLMALTSLMLYPPNFII
jgi:heme/copper-type cytochrome/quinol oxidase subunit 4